MPQTTRWCCWSYLKIISCVISNLSDCHVPAFSVSQAHTRAQEASCLLKVSGSKRPGCFSVTSACDLTSACSLQLSLQVDPSTTMQISCTVRDFKPEVSAHEHVRTGVAVDQCTVAFTDYHTLRIGGLVFAGIIVVLSVFLLAGKMFKIHWEVIVCEWIYTAGVLFPSQSAAFI